MLSLTTVLRRVKGKAVIAIKFSSVRTAHCLPVCMTLWSTNLRWDEENLKREARNNGKACATTEALQKLSGKRPRSIVFFLPQIEHVFVKRMKP